MSISNQDDIIDSRDIIERIEELENILMEEHEDQDITVSFEYWIQDKNNIVDNVVEYEEYIILKTLAEECEQCSADWSYGEQLIHEDYFKKYMDYMVDDCYTLPKDLPDWMRIVIDYEALKQDYTEVDFDGQTYFIRSF